MATTTKKHQQLGNEIIKHLYYNKMLTLTELSALCNKSLPMVTAIVNDLIDDGYVCESGLAPSTGGRRASTFLLNSAKKKYVVAVAMDQLVTQMVIYDLFNNEHGQVSVISIKLSEDEQSLQKLVSFIKVNLSRSGISNENLLGVGIGMPGFINARKGVNHSFFNLGDGYNLKDFLNRELDLPVFIDNDSSLIALAELKFGVGRGYKDVMVVNFGWGVGLGMIINGKLFRGHSGYAGEFSHIPLSKTNKLCSCGKRGCLEVETSLLVLVERAKEEMTLGATSRMQSLFADDNQLEGDHLLKAARNGDPLAVSILSDAAFLIGKGLSTLIHIMNPELIILGGRGAMAGRILMAPVQQAINEFCIPRLAEHTNIIVSEMAHMSELLGAATLVIENCEFN